MKTRELEMHRQIKYAEDTLESEGKIATLLKRFGVERRYFMKSEG